jgi:hypothetical protein
MAVTPVQAIGSTVTYLRRSLLGMVWNTVLADDDDDGEASRRAAAAPMRSAERKVDPTPYEAPPKSTASLRDAQWRVWLDKMRAAGDVLYRRQEFVEMANRASIGDALANGPPWVRSEISAYLAEGYARFPAEDEPAEEALGEVEIAGEDKVAAG